MRELTDPRLMYLKAWLLLLAGAGAAAGILIERPSVRVAFLLAVAVWSFCRLYYLLFYVVERYIDPTRRYAGIGAAVLEVVCGARGRARDQHPPGECELKRS